MNKKIVLYKVLVSLLFLISIGYLIVVNISNAFDAEATLSSINKIDEFNRKSYSILSQFTFDNLKEKDFSHSGRSTVFPRGLCVHPANPLGGGNYEVKGIIDINKDKISPMTMVVDDGITNNDNDNFTNKWNAFISYICFFAENMDANRNRDYLPLYQSDTLVVFRHLITSGKYVSGTVAETPLYNGWGTYMRSLSVPCFNYFWTHIDGNEGMVDDLQKNSTIKRGYRGSLSDTRDDNTLYLQALVYSNFIKNNIDNLNIKGLGESGETEFETELINSSGNTYIGPLYYEAPIVSETTMDETTVRDIQRYAYSGNTDTTNVVNNITKIADIQGATLADSNFYIKDESGVFSSHANIDEVNGKEFYLKLGSIEADSDKVTVQINNSYNIYIGRIFCFGVSGQDEVGVSGTTDVHESSITYTANAQPNVTITKKVYSVNGEIVNDDSAEVQIGDSVVFEIKIINKGSDVDKETILTDEFDSQLIAIKPEDYGWSGSGNSYFQKISEISSTPIIKHIRFEVGGYTTDASGKKIVDDINRGEILYNTATLSELPENNASGTVIFDDAYVQVQSYNTTINKIVNNIYRSDNTTNTGSKTYAEPGDIVQYKIRLTNNSECVIDNVKIEDIIPEGMTYYSHSETWNKSGNIYTYAGSIASNKVSNNYVNLYIKAKVNDDAYVDYETLTNKATTKEYQNRKDVYILEEESSQVTIDVLGYDYEITKVVNNILDNKGYARTNKTEAEPGDIIEYKITVNNKGDANIYVSLSDFIETSIAEQVLLEDETTTKIYTTADEKGIEVKPGDSNKKEFIIKTKAISKINNEKYTVTNKATITKVVNINDVNVMKDNENEDEVTVTVLGYQATLDKYIFKKNGAGVTNRSSYSDETKYNDPVVVKKGDTIVYRIALTNAGTAETTGNTALYNPQIIDDLLDGIEYKSHSDGWTKTGDIYEYNGNVGIGETVELDITCEVTKSNMYLFNIKNEANYNVINNRNNVDAKSVLETRNNTDYIRLDELDISGTVWEDKVVGESEEPNGVIDSGEVKISGIEVNLYSYDEGKVISTMTTNSEGKYTFTNVQKGLIRDANENYLDITGQGYRKYYIQFVYNGVTYESTEYADRGNINEDGSIKEAYKIDSNAAEIAASRENFNRSLETISYNLATGSDGSTQELTYTKDGQKSTLNYTDNLEMSAFSFVDIYEDEQIDDKCIYKSGDRLIWLGGDYTGDMSSHSVKENTDYLNYINLGLIKRDELDLSLTNKLEEIETVVNGQKMKYSFSNITGINKFTLYNSDYNYRYDAIDTGFNTNADDLKSIVEELKGIESELNIFVTFKTTVTNNSESTHVKVNEIAHFYDTNFKVFGDTVSIWLDNNNNGTVDIGEIEERNTITCQGGTIKKDSDLNYSDKELNGLNVVYINSDDVLAPKASKDIYITYTVDKDDRNLKVNPEKEGFEAQLKYISIIGQYSTYEDAGASKVAGLVDINSNPGNLGLKNNSEESTKNVKSNSYIVNYFENDTHISGIEFVVRENEVYKRKLSGLVWEDNVSQKEDGQKIGDGIHNPDENKIKDITVQLIEVIHDGDDNYYEIVRNQTTSNSGGNYIIEDYIPGNYIVRFKYGNMADENMIKYNGQDYKSTIYTLDEDTYANLTKEDISDARDDEKRRLEVMEYSLEMYNQKAEILKGVDSSNKQELVNNTNMFADTMKFFCDCELLVDREGALIDTDVIIRNSDPDKYDWSVEGEIIYIRIDDGYTIKNIDFGIQERPKTNIQLEKYISGIKLTTSAQDVLMDAKYKLYYDDELEYWTTEPDYENSVGLNNMQSINNTEEKQGFRYINVDEELLQGAIITITYGFEVINNSDVDHISNNLYGDASSTAEAKQKMDEAIENKNQNKKYSDSSSYYGEYLGGIYYTGEKADDDVIATLKIDMILDYVDNNMAFDSEKNGGKWIKTELDDLKGKYLHPDVYIFVEEDGTEIELIGDINGVAYKSETKSNLIVTVDDSNINESLAIFLEPGESAIVDLAVTSTLSAENESDDMEYVNIAEIIQFTSLTGRRTYDSTVGNAKVNFAGFVKDDLTLDEPDTSIVERVTLTPPTGADWIDTYLLTRVIIYVVCSIAVIALGILFIPKLVDKIKNRKFIK